MVIYTNDTFGNSAASETVYFTVELLAALEPEPFPSMHVIAAVAAIVVVFVGLLVYNKKCKREVEFS